MTDCQGNLSRRGSTAVAAYFGRRLRLLLRLSRRSESGSIHFEAEDDVDSSRPMSGPGRAFPTCSVTILALCMAVHSLTFVSLFPYVGIMVKSLLELKSTNEAGFYAGYVASAFTLGRFLSGYFWGYILDPIGRKPVIVVGLFATAVLSLVFGMSSAYSVAVASRFILGAMNGITPAIRTMVQEVCGTEHVLKAMAYIDGSRAVSIVFGSAVGGLLVQPVEHYPSLFSETGLFARFPFLIPNLVGASAALLMLLVVSVFLPETKDFERESLNWSPSRASFHVFSPKRTASKAAEEGEANGGAAPVEREPEPGVCGQRGVLRVPRVRALLMLVCTVQALLTGFEEVFPLWALSAVSVGGLGWSPVQIGQVLLATGLIMAPLQLFVFPPLINILGAVRWMQIGLFLGVSAFLATPHAKLFSRNDPMLFAVSVVSTTIVNCCLAAVSITLSVASTSIVPSNMRGKLSGIYNTAESFGRFTSAVGSAVLFAWSISPHASGYRWVHHGFVFYVFALALSAVAVLAQRTLTPDIFHRRPEEPAGRASCADEAAFAIVGGKENAEAENGVEDEGLLPGLE